MSKYYFKYGIGAGVIMILYFLLSKVLGLHEYPVFSALNGVIIGGAIFLALKTYKKSTSKFEYQDGFQIGLFTGGLATIIISAFMAFYIFQLDSEFAQAVVDSWPINFNKGSLILVISLVIMGFSTSLVLTLSFMQLLKESWNTPEGKRHQL
ncbi:DUF4199 domain-containing protein [Altibacter sp. HG106]|uniref:DUF4199 domain-containing protein n=1 Tax=Altibacter sp. HG106 TaxID=3023937 RepID=UPI00234FF024|nr:DUF4199 domain-containing protein [Altibacter sp. HG106]MDC7995212.1 DUF4199 domain-containing protein [Altibacter sp. HG106]